MFQSTTQMIIIFPGSMALVGLTSGLTNGWNEVLTPNF